MQQNVHMLDDCITVSLCYWLLRNSCALNRKHRLNEAMTITISYYSHKQHADDNFAGDSVRKENVLYDSYDLIDLRLVHIR